MDVTQPLLFGRTSQEPSVPTLDEISQQLSMSSLTAGRVTVDGEFWTRSFSESPSAAVESSLSQILEASVPEKYFLSPKACAGILSRADRRGKALPPVLQQALKAVVTTG